MTSEASRALRELLRAARRVAIFTGAGISTESGVPDFVVSSWVGLLAPAKTPAAILQRLNAELNAVLNDPAARERLAVLGIEPAPGSGEQFMQEMQRDLARYAPVVRAAGIRAE